MPNPPTMKQTKIISIILFTLLLTSCMSAQSELVSEVIQEGKGSDVIIGSRIKILSEVLQEEREILVSLPPKYDEHVQHYPVIFTFEAEYLFEVTQTVAKYMAARSKMPESIVVSLANGEFRKRHEANYKRWGGTPEKYIDFFKKELIPYLKANYRVTDHRTIVGLSPSSGFLYECFMREPSLFNAYIALSAHLEWDRVVGTPLIDELVSKNQIQDFPLTTFYLGRSAQDFQVFDGSEAAFTQAGTMLDSYEANRVNIKLDVIDEDEHYLMVLRGLRSALGTIYPDRLWRNPGKPGWDKQANYAKLLYKDHYDQLSAYHGFTIYPVEDAHADGYSITGLARSAQKWGTGQQFMDLAALGSQYFPNSAQLHCLLAEAYHSNNQAMKARSTAETSLSLAKKYCPEQEPAFRARLASLLD